MSKKWVAAADKIGYFLSTKFTFLHAGYFDFFCLIFFKFNSYKFLQYHQSVNHFAFRSEPKFMGPDLGPNCWQSQSLLDYLGH